MGDGSRRPGRTVGPRVPAVLVLTVLLAAVTSVLSPAQAAPDRCAGVVVVVEPPGSTDRVDCVPDAGDRSAAELFEAAGHELTRVQRFPGAVCRVDGVPADQACVVMPPTDAYWGLFHAGDDGWAYAAAGIDLLEPARGDSVALVWQDTATETTPTHAPGAGSAAPTPVSGRDVGGADDPTAGVTVPLAVPLLALGALLVSAVLVSVRRRRA